MTLVPLVAGWALVAVWFVVSGALVERRRPNGTAVLTWLGEALVLTLVGGLWFATLGAGQWWILFTLLGLLVAGTDRGLRIAFLRSGLPGEALGALLGTGRYLAAGALLAWLLR